MSTLSLSSFETFAETVYNNRKYQFWLLQFAGWGGLCVVTFLSLTLWYNTVQWPYIAHTFLQSFLGMILSLPLHTAYLSLWSRSLSWRLSVSLLAVTVVSLVWTALRIQTFMWITSEQGIWSDFGGWYVLSFLVYLCWSALYYGNKYYYQAQQEKLNSLQAKSVIKEEQLKRLKAESDARDSQLGMLRYQLNPHFLFNTLNNISALVKFQENDKAHMMITQLGQFLRYSLDNDPAQKISMQQEIEALMLYLNIEKTRFGEHLILQFDIEEQAKTALVPSLLLQPLAENSVKYAIAVNEEGGAIHLVAAVRQGELRIEMKDTGPGNGGGRSTPRTGRRIGLHNTLQRLKTLYNDAYVFDIKLRQCGGLKINIRIPYESA